MEKAWKFAGGKKSIDYCKLVASLVNVSFHHGQQSPQALTESTSIVCLPTMNGLMLAVSSQSGGWVGSVPEEGEVVWSTLEQNSYTW